MLGRGYQVADIITGALVLAVVTSLPNAVAAIYLARRGRGAAVLSTALNSNAINVTAGLLIPASLTGLRSGSGQDTLVAAWYAGLTLLALAFAWRDHGLDRIPGIVIIAGYAAFATALIISVNGGPESPGRRHSRSICSFSLTTPPSRSQAPARTIGPPSWPSTPALPGSTGSSRS